MNRKAVLGGGALLLLILLLRGGKKKAEENEGSPLVSPLEEPSSHEEGAPLVSPGGDVTLKVTPPKAKPKKKSSGAGKEEAAKRAASKAYQLAAAAGFDHSSASAFAIRAYHDAGGTAKDVIANWQGEIGVPPTGEYDNATTRRVKELT